MSGQPLKDFYREKIESCRNDFVADLEAMSESQLADRPGSADRCPFDVTYEIAQINRRFVSRLLGQTPASLGEGFMVAPRELCSKGAAIENLRSSFDELLVAWSAEDPESLFRTIDLGNGQTSSPLEYAHLATVHASYHDGQLNLLQAMSGDAAVHWR